MSTNLTNKDYISILKYYNMPIPKSKRILKKQAETIMAEKKKERQILPQINDLY